MIRVIFYLLLIVAAIAGVAWGISQGTGYVLITFDHYRYESTLWVFLGVLFALWLVVFLARRILRLLAVSGALINPWSRRNRERRVLKATLYGQRELAEGRWEQALGHLTLAADNDSRPLVHFLGAARAANEMSQYEQCDRLLSRALTREPEASLAIGLTRAQLLIERNDLVAARDVLSDLHREFAKQPQVLGLLQRLYVQLGDWDALCKLLPELRRNKVLPDAKLDDLEHLAWCSVLALPVQNVAQEEAAIAQALEHLEHYWREMPARLQVESPLVLAYATALRQLSLNDRAAEALFNAITRQPEAALIELYGQIETSDSMQQLLRAEAWLGTSPEDANLLLALGRLSARSELWEKARQYLDSSLQLAYRAETCAELARVLAQLGDKERSNQLFMESLALQGRALPALQ